MGSTLVCLLLPTAGALVLPTAGMQRVAVQSLVLRNSPPAASISGEPVETGTMPKNIGEAKTAFQAKYGRPVSGLQQGFVNEMLSAVTLAVSTPSYAPSRIFYLGFNTLCTTFLEGVASDAEREALTNGLSYACGLDAKRLAQQAEEISSFAQGKSEDELFASDDFTSIAGNIKYSYPLGAGLLALMPMAGVEEINDEVITRWCDALKLPPTRLQKDYAFFEDAKKKLVEVRQMMLEMSAAAKRKEAAKLKEKAEEAAAAADAADAEAAAAE